VLASPLGPAASHKFGAAGEAATGTAGVCHHVEVSAESLLKAAALGLAALKGDGWVDGPGRGATLEIAVVEPVVKHSVPVARVMRWLDGATTSPNEKVKKQKLKALLG
jgi:hypothetical protein